jgi:long-chain acyl-CoA synthetase
MTMADTVVSRFFANADRLGARPMAHYFAGGHWVPVGWRTAAGLVRDFAAGLIDLGHQKGDVTAILSATRREWTMADLGNLAAGGVTVGVYPSMTAEQSRYVIAHCEARFVVVEDAKQLAKLDAVRAGLPRLETVILIDWTGVPPRPSLLTITDVLERGRAARHDVQRRIGEIQLEDAAMFVYTSGTTGPPKGAMLTHGNIAAALKAVQVFPLEVGDSGFSFLPLAHVLQRLVDYRGAWEGVPGYFGRSLDTVAEDLVAARPTVMAAVPRIFEKIYARICEQAAASTPTKRKIFDWALAVGRQVSDLRTAHAPIPPALAAQHRVARALVYDKLRDRLGGRVRAFVTGGAPIAVEILQFFDSAGISLLEGWGMTETFGAGTINLPDDRRFGSIGKPLPGVEMKLDEDGEILIRGGNVFSGYYKDDDATKTAFTSDGFFRTGDIGKIDGDGFFYIIDRKKDLIITAAGKNIAPQNIENLLKTDPRISQVMAVGDRRPYVVALIAVTPELRAKITHEAEVLAIVEEIVRTKNAELASYERIKKFRILPADLTQESGDLTPTLKLKRKVVAEKYAGLIEEMYSEGKLAATSSA